MQRGFVAFPVLLAIIVLVVVVLAGPKVLKNSNLLPTKAEVEEAVVVSETPVSTPNSSPAPSPTSIPKIKVTSTPTPSPKPTATQVSINPCDKFKPGDGLATITVSLQASSGSVVGDAIVKIKATGDCPGAVPGGGQITDIIRQGSSWTSPGLTPGKFRIDVEYHGAGQGLDVDAVSGGNSVTVTVSN